METYVVLGNFDVRGLFPETYGAVLHFAYEAFWMEGFAEALEVLKEKRRNA